MKNRQPPGIELGPLTLAVSALPPELWPCTRNERKEEGMEGEREGGREGGAEVVG